MSLPSFIVVDHTTCIPTKVSYGDLKKNMELYGSDKYSVYEEIHGSPMRKISIKELIKADYQRRLQDYCHSVDRYLRNWDNNDSNTIIDWNGKKTIRGVIDLLCCHVDIMILDKECDKDIEAAVITHIDNMIGPGVYFSTAYEKREPCLKFDKWKKNQSKTICDELKKEMAKYIEDDE
jgi:hypothetical protein